MNNFLLENQTLENEILKNKAMPCMLDIYCIILFMLMKDIESVNVPT